MTSEDNLGLEYDFEESSAPSSKRTKTSVVWDKFDRFKDDKGLPRAKCKECGKVYMAREDGGTSNMKRHVGICAARGDVSSYPPLNQEKYREKISEVIVKHGYPFSFVEHEGIKELHSFLNPHAKLISRNTAKSDVIKLYKKEKENLKCCLRSIPGKFCLTSDLWSSITTDQYMVITAHYMTKDWELEKKILAFFHMPPPHTGANLAEKLLSLLKEWGIEKKIFTITLDNASYNDTMVTTLKTHSSGLGLVANGAYFHVRCGAHILNLIVQDGLKVVEGSLTKIRESVKYVRGQEARKIKFASCLELISCVTPKKLRQDVPTRWNSTYLMLERALVFREAFTHFKNMDPHYDISFSEEEWAELERLAEFLKPFYDITTIFSGRTYPTANLFFYGVWKIHLQLKEAACMFHDDFETENRFCCMAKRMKKKFQKYWDNYSTILSFAVILDPRYKLQFVEYSYVTLYGVDVGLKLAEDISNKLKVFFQEYLNSSSSDENPSSSISPRGSPSITPSHVLEDFSRYQSKLCTSTRKESDLESYLLAKRMDHEKHAALNVLEFWKSSEGKYPKLSLMARDVLSIPITTVASESAFSIGGRILDKYRSSLLPENVEAIICTNDWLCGTPATLDLDGDELVEDLGALSISMTMATNS